MSKGLDRVLHSSLASPRQIAIYRLGIVASDFIRFWPIAALLAGVAMLMSLFHFTGLFDVSRDMALKGYHALCGLVAFVVALGCGNDDRERGTLWMLRALPFSTGRLLAEKFVVCGLLIGLFLLLAELVLWPMSDFGTFFASIGALPYPSFWRFGTSWPLSIAQFVCLVLLGLAAGVRFNNFVTAALAGLGVYVVWYTTWLIGCRPIEISHKQVFRFLMVLQQLILAGAAAYGFMRFSTYFNSGYISATGDATDAVTKRALSLTRWKFQLPGEAHVSPYRGRVIGCALWLCLIVWVVCISSTPAKLQVGQEGSFILVSPVLAAALLGCLLFNRNELVGYRGQIYFLPVSRANLLWQRVWLITGCVLVLAIGALIASGIANDITTYTLPCIALGAAYLSITLRFLFRNAIFAMVVTCVIIGLWTILAFGGAINGSISMETFPRMFYQCWVMVFFTLFPLLCLYLTYVKSWLLALGGTTRSFLGISVAFTICTVGSLLVTMNPVEAVWLVFDWIAPLGPEVVL